MVSSRILSSNIGSVGVAVRQTENLDSNVSVNVAISHGRVQVVFRVQILALPELRCVAD